MAVVSSRYPAKWDSVVNWSLGSWTFGPYWHGRYPDTGWAVTLHFGPVLWTFGVTRQKHGPPPYEMSEDPRGRRVAWRPVMRIGEAERLPRFHGFAYRPWESMSAVTAVVPLNLVLATGRFLWMEVRVGWFVPFSRRDRELRRAWLAGRREGYGAALEAIDREYDRRCDAALEAFRQENIAREAARAAKDAEPKC